MYAATLTTLIVAGLYLILLAFMFNAPGFMSTLLYKLIPFVLGAALLFIAADISGVVTVGTPGTPEGLGARAGPVACVSGLKLPTAEGQMGPRQAGVRWVPLGRDDLLEKELLVPQKESCLYS